MSLRHVLDRDSQLIPAKHGARLTDYTHGGYADLRNTMILTLLILMGLLPMLTLAQDSKIEIIAVEGQIEVDGEFAYIELLVVIEPGADRGQVIADELALFGAEPVEEHDERHAEAQAVPPGIVLLPEDPMVWSQFTDADPTNDTVVQYYNPNNNVDANTEQYVLETQQTWSSVSDSDFHMSYGGLTTRCPSLVPPCNGGEFVYDGYNDVGWVNVPGSASLGVTGYGFNGNDEADIAFNLALLPTYLALGFIDTKTVLLHEQGHVAGLGHPVDTSSVMYPCILCTQHTLTPDAETSIRFLYPDPDPVVNDLPVVGFNATPDDFALQAVFVDSSTDDDIIATWVWDFGDGNGSTERDITHTYGATGDYLVTLTVTDQDGGSSSTSQTVSLTVPTTVDVNADGFVTPRDTIYVINRIGSTNPADAAADVDGNGIIDTADVDWVISFLGNTLP